MLYVIGNIVHAVRPAVLEVLTDHVIAVEHGVITVCQKTADFCLEPSEGDSVIRLKPTQFLFPGFVDTHIHAPQYPNVGIFGNSTLLDWLNVYTFPMEDKFSQESAAEAVYSQLIKRQLENGTTLASYFGTIHVPASTVLARLCLKLGLRAKVGRVCMERFCPEYLQSASTESELEFIENLRSLDTTERFVQAIITPRFAPSCTALTLAHLGELAKTQRLPVQTHVSENVDEISWVASLFPDAASYCDVYDQAGLLKDDTVLAHAIHLTDAEIELVRQRGCGISHCPESNAALASGIAPIKKYLRLGVKVGLGTDVSAGSTVSVLKNARLALLVSRLLYERVVSNRSEVDVEANVDEHALSVDDVLSMATLGGAQVLNMQHLVGNFELGKHFDAQIVDVLSEGSLIDLFEYPVHETTEKFVRFLLNKWVYVGDDRNTVCVFVNGKIVYSSGCFSGELATARSWT